jgi:uncharacterized protein DUF3311
MRPAKRLAVIALAALPSLALTLAIPLANRMEPSVGGAPFLLLWIIGWVIATPICLVCISKLEQRT